MKAHHLSNPLSYSLFSQFLGCRKAFDYRVKGTQANFPVIKSPLGHPFGQLVTQGITTAIETQDRGGKTGKCIKSSMTKMEKNHAQWMASIKVPVGLTKLEHLEACVETLNVAKDVVGRAIKVLELGKGKWETVSILKKGKKIPGIGFRVKSSLKNWATGFEGHIDWVAKELGTDKVCLFDFRTTKNLQEDLSLFMDYKLPLLQQAFQDTTGIHIDRHHVLQLRASVARAPRLLRVDKDGKCAGVSKSKICTTWEKYKSTVMAAGFNLRDYLDMEAKLPAFDKLSSLYRSSNEIKNIWKDLDSIAYEINLFLSETDPLTPRRLHTMQCRKCHFQEPCFEELKVAV